MSSPVNNQKRSARRAWIFTRDKTITAPSPSSSTITPPSSTSITLDKSRHVLQEKDNNHVLGYSFPTHKKWTILTIVFIVQISMNFNAAVFPNAVSGMTEEFGVSVFTTKIAQMLFLVMYAFGCEAWAPWSEELGRFWVMQGSLFLVNCWALGAGFATNFPTIMAMRALGGLSSAGGSVTLGMVADMWGPNEQQYAVAYTVLGSVAGSVVAPIAGGFIETYLNWRWNFYIQVIFGVVVQAMHFFLVPETRASVMLDRYAKKLRKTGENPNACGPNEAAGSLSQRISLKEIARLMGRPYKLLLSEPIVLFLSLLSGFSDALIFMSLDSYPLILEQWGFTKIQMGLAFITLLIAYLIAYGLFMWRYKYDRKMLRTNPDKFSPERRLWLLLWLAPLEPIGLAILGASSLGPPQMHWMISQLGVNLVGIANFAIYMGTIDYMIASYGPFAASATGGNGWCRDAFAGAAALYTKPFYTNIMKGTKWQLPAATWILGGVGCLLIVPIYIFSSYGEWFRKRSPYASKLAEERAQIRADSVPSTRANSVELDEL